MKKKHESQRAIEFSAKHRYLKVRHKWLGGLTVDHCIRWDKKPINFMFAGRMRTFKHTYFWYYWSNWIVCACGTKRLTCMAHKYKMIRYWKNGAYLGTRKSNCCS